MSNQTYTVLFKLLYNETNLKKRYYCYTVSLNNDIRVRITQVCYVKIGTCNISDCWRISAMIWSLKFYSKPIITIFSNNILWTKIKITLKCEVFNMTLIRKKTILFQNVASRKIKRPLIQHVSGICWNISNLKCNMGHPVTLLV